MPNTKLDMNLNQYLINLNLQQICIRIMDDYGYTCIFVEIKAIDNKKKVTISTLCKIDFHR